MPSKRPVAVLVLRLLLAAVFMVSAVAKLLAIDDFELYVFSYGFFSLNASYLVARICIAVEFLVGLFLALGWWARWVQLLALAMLLFFSLFLCYAALVGRTDFCQCFGRLADFSPAQSLLKNAVLIVLVLLLSKFSRLSRTSRLSKLSVIFSILFVLASFVAVFCISVPDNWWAGPEECRYDKVLLEEALSPDGALAEEGLAEGHQLVAFVTPGCPMCRMAREKLSSIASRHHLDSAAIHYYEPQELPDALFLQITYGQRPLILLLDNGVPVVTYHYRNINEKEIAGFLR
ncbi:MAG: thioredoxin family protein [Bacteroidales bacterium]|nr:thioredoxin family protein [Bacteroidales bacterium]